MSNMYDDFEQRFTNAPFFAGWVDFEIKPAKSEQKVHKDLDTLNSEMELIKEQIEKISIKQVQLSELSKFYQ